MYVFSTQWGDRINLAKLPKSLHLFDIVRKDRKQNICNNLQ